jgi:chromosome segregation ATPase
MNHNRQVKEVTMNKGNTSMAVDQKAELLKKVREAVKQVEMDFQETKTATQKLLRESEAKQDKILDLLNKQMRQLVSEKDEVEKRAKAALSEKAEAEKQAKAAFSEKAKAEEAVDAAIKEKEAAEKKADSALDEKAEAEKSLAEATKNIEALREQITSLKGDLDKSVTIAETAVRERGQLQEKLTQFQENWEKYIGSK